MGNFYDVTKPIIKEILEKNRITLERLLVFKRIVIVKQIQQEDFEKAFARGKESTQSANFYSVWMKDSTLEETKNMYNKIRDIIIEDNPRCIYDYLTVTEVKYDTNKRGSIVGSMGVIGYKRGVDRTE